MAAVIQVGNLYRTGHPSQLYMFNSLTPSLGKYNVMWFVRSLSSGSETSRDAYVAAQLIVAYAPGHFPIKPKTKVRCRPAAAGKNSAAVREINQRPARTRSVVDVRVMRLIRFLFLSL